MKRLLAASILAAALAAPAAATASSDLDASATEAPSAKRGVPSFKINFDVYREGRKPVGVDNFVVKNLRIDCDQGPFLLNFSLNVPGPFPDVFPVQDRKFNAQGTGDESEAKITGRFVTNKKVKGKVKTEGNFDGPDADPDLDLTNCEGSRRYTAR